MSAFKKSVSLLVILTFLFSNISFALEDNTQTEPEKQGEPKLVLTANTIGVPKDFGAIKDRFIGKDKRLIIHVQDAHCNYEAQTNIANILETLYKDYKIDFVSLEGADGIIDTAWFKAFPDAEIRKEVADYFMKKGEITGAEFLSITTDYPITLFGAETRDLYIKNLNTFTSSYPSKETIEKYFLGVKSVLNKLKNYIYSKTLREIDSKIIDYKEKRLSLSDYAKFLNAGIKKHNIPLHAYHNFGKLVYTLKYEDKIDFKIVDRERSALIDVLSKALSKDALSELVLKSFSFKTGRISSAQYYEYLKNLSEQNGINLQEEYLNLHYYCIYTRLYDKINNELLFKEIHELKELVKEKVIKNEDQKALNKLSNHIDILIDLINIKLANGDFDYYKNNKSEFNMDEFLTFINAKVGKYNLSYDIEDTSDIVKENLPKLAKFYELAVVRDKALVNNTLKGMKRQNDKVGILVTGGFHTEGITKLLKKKGISYVVICPTITEEVESPYIQVLTNQRTPLEQLLLEDIAPPEKGVLGTPVIARVMFWPRAALEKTGQGVARLRDRVKGFVGDWAGLHKRLWIMDKLGKVKENGLYIAQALDNDVRNIREVLAYYYSVLVGQNLALATNSGSVIPYTALRVDEKGARPLSAAALRESMTRPSLGIAAGAVKSEYITNLNYLFRHPEFGDAALTEIRRLSNAKDLEGIKHFVEIVAARRRNAEEMRRAFIDYKGYDVIIVSTPDGSLTREKQAMLEKVFGNVKTENEYTGGNVIVLSVTNDIGVGQNIGQAVVIEQAQKLAQKKGLKGDLGRLIREGKIKVAVYHDGGAATRKSPVIQSLFMSRADTPMGGDVAINKETGETMPLTLILFILARTSGFAQTLVPGTMDVIWLNQVGCSSAPNAELTREEGHPLSKMLVRVDLKRVDPKDVFYYGLALTGKATEKCRIWIAKFFGNKFFAKPVAGRYEIIEERFKEVRDAGDAGFDYGSYNVSWALQSALNDFYTKIGAIEEAMEKKGKIEYKRDLDPHIMQPLQALLTGLEGKEIPEGIPSAAELRAIEDKAGLREELSKAEALLMESLNGECKKALAQTRDHEHGSASEIIWLYLMYRDAGIFDLGEQFIGYIDLGVKSHWRPYKSAIDDVHGNFVMLADLYGVLELNPETGKFESQEATAWDKVEAEDARYMRGITKDDICRFRVNGKEHTLTYEEVKKGVTIDGVWIKNSVVQNCDLYRGSRIVNSVVLDSEGKINAEYSLIANSVVLELYARHSYVLNLVSDDKETAKSQILVDCFRESLKGRDPRFTGNRDGQTRIRVPNAYDPKGKLLPGLDDETTHLDTVLTPQEIRDTELDIEKDKALADNIRSIVRERIRAAAGAVQVNEAMQKAEVIFAKEAQKAKSENTLQTALNNLRQWLTEDRFIEYRDVILELVVLAERNETAAKELYDSFWRVIPFGTGGRRWKVGIGPNRMNAYMAAMTAQGHVEYLRSQYPDEVKRGDAVVSAWDVRAFHKFFAETPALREYREIIEKRCPVLSGLSSEDLSKVAALVYAGNGIKYIHPAEMRSTPWLSFLVNRFSKIVEKKPFKGRATTVLNQIKNIVAGIVLSSSHNPYDNNGTKFYEDSGAQAPPQIVQKLMDLGDKVETINYYGGDLIYKEGREAAFKAALEAGLVTVLEGEDLKTVDDAYIRTVIEEVKSVYTDEEWERLRPWFEKLLVSFNAINGTGVTGLLKALEALKIGVLRSAADKPTWEFPEGYGNIPNPEAEKTFNTTMQIGVRRTLDWFFGYGLPQAQAALTAVIDEDGKRISINDLEREAEEGAFSGTDDLINHIRKTRNKFIRGLVFDADATNEEVLRAVSILNNLCEMTDPDADRIGVGMLKMERVGREMRLQWVSANDNDEAGIVLFRYRLEKLRKMAEEGRLTEYIEKIRKEEGKAVREDHSYQLVVVNTVVSNTLEKKIAETISRQIEELTDGKVTIKVVTHHVGFKFTGEIIDNINKSAFNGIPGVLMEKAGVDLDKAFFIMSSEEGEGSLIGFRGSIDKCSAVTGLSLAVLAAELLSQERTMYDYLMETYKIYGYSKAYLEPMVMTGAYGFRMINEDIMGYLRGEFLSEVNDAAQKGEPVKLGRFTLTGGMDHLDLMKPEYGEDISQWPQAVRESVNILEFYAELEDGTKITIVARPSGTEAKHKNVVMVVGAPLEEGENLDDYILKINALNREVMDEFMILCYKASNAEYESGIKEKPGAYRIADLGARDLKELLLIFPIVVSCEAKLGVYFPLRDWIIEASDELAGSSIGIYITRYNAMRRSIKEYLVNFKEENGIQFIEGAVLSNLRHQVEGLPGQVDLNDLAVEAIYTQAILWFGEELGKRHFIRLIREIKGISEDTMRNMTAFPHAAHVTLEASAGALQRPKPALAAISRYWSRKPAPLPKEAQLREIMKEFVRTLRSFGVKSIEYDTEGGIESIHGKSFLGLEKEAAKKIDIAHNEADEGNLFYRGANNLRDINAIVSKGLIVDQKTFERFQDLVIYTMLHGFVEIPVKLKTMFGTTRARLHFTMFMPDHHHMPGSMQYQPTSGHYQGNLLDIKYIVQGKAVQYLPRLNSKGELVRARAIYLDAGNERTRFAFVLPGDIDIFYALEPRTAFFNISLEISPERATEIFNVEKTWAENPKAGEEFIKNFPSRGAAHVILNLNGYQRVGINPDKPFGESEIAPLIWAMPVFHTHNLFKHDLFYLYEQQPKTFIDLRFDRKDRLQKIARGVEYPASEQHRAQCIPESLTGEPVSAEDINQAVVVAKARIAPEAKTEKEVGRRDRQQPTVSGVIGAESIQPIVEDIRRHLEAVEEDMARLETELKKALPSKEKGTARQQPTAGAIDTSEADARKEISAIRKIVSVTACSLGHFETEIKLFSYLKDVLKTKLGKLIASGDSQLVKDIATNSYEWQNIKLGIIQLQVEFNIVKQKDMGEIDEHLRSAVRLARKVYLGTTVGVVSETPEIGAGAVKEESQSAHWKKSPVEDDIYKLWHALVRNDNDEIREILDGIRSSENVVYTTSIPPMGKSRLSNALNLFFFKWRSSHPRIMANEEVDRFLCDALTFPRLGLKLGSRDWEVSQPFFWNAISEVINNLFQHVIARYKRAFIIAVSADPNNVTKSELWIYVLDSGPGMKSIRKVLQGEEKLRGTTTVGRGISEFLRNLNFIYRSGFLMDLIYASKGQTYHETFKLKFEDRFSEKETPPRGLFFCLHRYYKEPRTPGKLDLANSPRDIDAGAVRQPSTAGAVNKEEIRGIVRQAYRSPMKYERKEALKTLGRCKDLSEVLDVIQEEKKKAKGGERKGKLGAAEKHVDKVLYRRNTFRSGKTGEESTAGAIRQSRGAAQTAELKEFEQPTIAGMIDVETPEISMIKAITSGSVLFKSLQSVSDFAISERIEPAVGQIPATQSAVFAPRQIKLSRKLRRRLKKIGVQVVSYEDHGTAGAVNAVIKLVESKVAVNEDLKFTVMGTKGFFRHFQNQVGKQGTPVNYALNEGFLKNCRMLAFNPTEVTRKGEYAYPFAQEILVAAIALTRLDVEDLNEKNPIYRELRNLLSIITGQDKAIIEREMPNLIIGAKANPSLVVYQISQMVAYLLVDMKKVDYDKIRRKAEATRDVLWSL